uniref:Uncharacterized protein n=1 Tax=Ornithorhynchus anatinus TaxID=9258 RepID=A0A6I8NP16_ORNAN
MSESSSDLNTSNDEICKSNLSHYSNLNENRTGPVLSRNRRTCHQNCDSGRVSLAQGQDLEQQLSANSFRYLTWHQLEDHEVQGNQLCCPRVREGPPEEELKFRQEEYALPPRKRTPEKGKWQEWLQENWEECLVRLKGKGIVGQIQNRFIIPFGMIWATSLGFSWLNTQINQPMVLIGHFICAEHCTKCLEEYKATELADTFPE